MLFDKSRNRLIPSESGSYSLMMIECHGHSVTRAANGNPLIDLSTFHRLGKRVCEITVITTLRAVCPEIHDFISLLQKICDKLGLVLKACMITANTYSHNIIVLQDEDTYFSYLCQILPPCGESHTTIILTLHEFH